MLYAAHAFAFPENITALIRIDQFGYRNADQKIAVISDPQVGYNAGASFSPGNEYQIKDWNTDAVVFSGALQSWNGGALHEQSGDKVWWFDFSTVSTTGSYYVFDVANNVGSYRFEINPAVYEQVLKAACRANFYQRCGMAKALPFAQSAWVDDVCHLGELQDYDCRLVSDTSAATSKDLSGGWHDAGDYNKYVNYAWNPVLDMLLAYEETPTVWKDNFDIPESGNSIPDILDEVKYELDWLLKMQNPDGSILSVVGTEHYATASPPSNDFAQRKYGPATTQASYAAAGMFALASIQFQSIGQAVYANTLRQAAVKAWDWAEANPGIIFHNNDGATNFLAAGDQESEGIWNTDRRHIAAAAYLFALTGESRFSAFVDDHYLGNSLMSTIGAVFPNATENDALLYYAKTPGATPDTKNDILEFYRNSMKNSPPNLPAFTQSADAYRAFISQYDWATDSYISDYNWGSNVAKSRQGSMFLSVNQLHLDDAHALDYANAASGFVHYFHGVNPNGKTFLSNMAQYGAENSVASFYHSWFSDGSEFWDEVGISTFGPAPGFVPGGPNQHYDTDICCATNCDPQCDLDVSPPKNQPPQKSYKDFNTSWPLNSWTVTENQIYSQASYIRMLSKFCLPGSGSVAENSPNALANGLSIAPNPAGEETYIVIPERLGSQTVQLFNVVGQLVQEITVEGAGKINTSGLRSGIYFVRLKGQPTLMATLTIDVDR